MKIYHTDWLVIGSGAGGSIIFHELSKANKDVLLIEEGFHIGTQLTHSSIQDRISNFYRNGGVTPIFGNNIFPFSEGRVVGGTTELNGSLFWRTPEWILSEWKESMAYLL